MFPAVARHHFGLRIRVAVTGIERVVITYREDVLAVIVQHDSGFVVGRNSADQFFRSLAIG